MEENYQRLNKEKLDHFFFQKQPKHSTPLRHNDKHQFYATVKI
jgi:hypothetical protein